MAMVPTEYPPSIGGILRITVANTKILGLGSNECYLWRKRSFDSGGRNHCPALPRLVGPDCLRSQNSLLLDVLYQPFEGLNVWVRYVFCNSAYTYLSSHEIRGAPLRPPLDVERAARLCFGIFDFDMWPEAVPR
jgi:hypothetical protein